MEEGKADVDKVDDKGCTPLIMAAQNGHMEVVRFLVEEGKADVDKATTDDGSTPLLLAAQKGHTEVVRFLVCLLYTSPSPRD